MSTIAVLEVWLIGTPTDLDTAVTALARLGHVAQDSRTRLGGADAGRSRVYLRITTIPTTTAKAASAASARPPARSLLDAA